MKRQLQYHQHRGDLRARLKQHVNPDVLRAVHVLQPWKHALVAAGWICLTGLCAGLTAQTRWPWLWPVAVLLQGFHLLGFTILLHEQVHDCIARGRPRLNAALGLLYAAPCAMSPTQFRHWHLDHHNELGSDTLDPKRANLSPRRNTRWLKLAYLTPALFPIYFRGAAREVSTYPPEVQARIRRERRGMVALHLTIVTTLWAVGGWWLAVRVHLAPLLLGFPVAFVINRLGQHYWIDPDEPAKWSSRVDGNPLWRWLFLWSNHHIEHHYYPRVPCYNLTRLNRALHPFFEAQGIRNRTYRQLLTRWFVNNEQAHTAWREP